MSGRGGRPPHRTGLYRQAMRRPVESSQRLVGVLIPVSHPVLSSFTAAAALLLLGSAYLLAGDSAAGAAPVAVAGVGLLLSAVRITGRRSG
jgi:hypothetical protein